MRKFLKFLLPLGFVTVCVIVLVLMYAGRPQADKRPVEPLVSVTPLFPAAQKIPVFTRGTVTPGTEIPLVSEVSGPVTFVSENYARGGFFKKGEVLIRVDGVEYDVTRKKADAQLAQALQLLKQAEAEKRVRGAAKGLTDNALARFDYQYQQAKAQYDAARAELESINMQKRKTTIVAPFDGRVRMASVNLGQYLRPGFQLGVIYAVNAAEVRLPLSDSQLNLVNIPYSFSGDATEGPKVKLVREYGGRKFTWEGQVVRSESGVDEFNRLLYLIASIPDPYAIDPLQPDRPPLTAGNFVEAEIEGKAFPALYQVPRRALRNGAQVWVVNQEQRLARKEIDILYKGRDVVFVRGGLASGDRVVLSQLDIAVEGMRVRTREEQTTLPPSEIAPVNDLLSGATPETAPVVEIAPVKAVDPIQIPAEAPAPVAESGSLLGAQQLQKLNDTLSNASPQQAAAAIQAARAAASALAPGASAEAREGAQKRVSALADLINETESNMEGGAPVIPANGPPPVSPSVPPPATEGGVSGVSAPRILSESPE